MQSPVGRHSTLERIELEPNLVAWRCPETGGLWIPAENYWRWRHSLAAELLEDHSTGAPAPTGEYDETVKLCPESGTIMTRYRVGHGLEFRVDRSNTGGIWLDAGEWEALKASGLHGSIHKIFTAPWQQAVRDESRDAVHREQLLSRLGHDLVARLESLRAELSSHPERKLALAYLQGIK